MNDRNLAELLDTPENPVPPGAEVLILRTSDGVRLRAAWWPAREGSAGRGTVLILQGRAEFIEKYHETVGELRLRGFSVAAFDWRGQGGADRAGRDPRHGHIRHFDDFRLDVAAATEQLLAPRTRGPVHVLAHSMGGCVALIGAAEGWLGATSLVALAPMIGLSLVRRPRVARAIATTLNRLGLGRRLIPGGRLASISTLPFDGNRLCTDPIRYARNAAIATALGSGAIGSPTVGWVAAAYEAMRRLAGPGEAGRIVAPTLIVATGDDPICSTPAAELFARGLSHGRALVVPGARHEILHETDALRAVFWEAFDVFMEEVEGGTGARDGRSFAEAAA